MWSISEGKRYAVSEATAFLQRHMSCYLACAIKVLFRAEQLIYTMIGVMMIGLLYQKASAYVPLSAKSYMHKTYYDSDVMRPASSSVKSSLVGTPSR